jgi:hypothetical protein
VTSAVKDEPQPAFQRALDTFAKNARRDYLSLRDHLKKLDTRPEPRPVPSLADLAKEAQDHYWVQYQKDRAWIDLDPSFADAKPGQVFARAGKTFETLPDEVCHWVELRLRLEEYPIYLQKDTPAKPQDRVVLTFKTRAAALSGLDVALVHQPENWQGPSEDLQSALASALKETGRFKPVLLHGSKWSPGEPFRVAVPTGKGIGGVGGLLAGQGTRTPTPIVTAEWIEFDFIQPGGRKETVVREVFDLAGPARRAEKKHLAAGEVRKLTSDEAATRTGPGIYSLVFTTGTISGAHLRQVKETSARKKGEPPEIGRVLHRLGLSFFMFADAVRTPWQESDGTGVRWYPASGRVVITEMSKRQGHLRLAMDLRWNPRRVIALNTSAEDVFHAQVSRGVIDGTTERILVGFLSDETLFKKGLWPRVVSTSSVMEESQRLGIAQQVLTPKTARVDAKVSPETAARLRGELDRGWWVVVPEREVKMGTRERLAWWRVDPRSGETVGVTDEGLHGTSAEYSFVNCVVVRLGGALAGSWMLFYAGGTDPEIANSAEEMGMMLGQFIEKVLTYNQIPIITFR